jgi:hypothetical protein
MGSLERIGGYPVFAGPNTIAIKLGDYLQGTAEGPLGIGALLLIFLTAFAIAEIRRRRR